MLQILSHPKRMTTVCRRRQKTGAIYQSPLNGDSIQAPPTAILRTEALNNDQRNLVTATDCYNIKGLRQRMEDQPRGEFGSRRMRARFRSLIKLSLQSSIQHNQLARFFSHSFNSSFIKTVRQILSITLSLLIYHSSAPFCIVIKKSDSIECFDPTGGAGCMDRIATIGGEL